MARLKLVKRDGAGSESPPAKGKPLDWERWQETISQLYSTENRPLPEVCQIMKTQHDFEATPRMYKTKFRAWGLRKYRQQRKCSTSGIRTPTHSNNLVVTPSSGKWVMSTPGSSSESQRRDSSQSTHLLPISIGSVPGRGDMNEAEKEGSISRRTSCDGIHTIQSLDESITIQVEKHVKDLWHPWESPPVTPSSILQTLMKAGIASPDWPRTEPVTIPDDVQDYQQVLDPVSQGPWIWANLCFVINIRLGQGRIEEANHEMGRAMIVYMKLAQVKSDELLSLPSLILATFYLHGKSTLAARLLSQAQVAASRHLDDHDPIISSITFMIAMALRKPKSFPVKDLRRIAEAMQTEWGENHRFSVVADYHLAWRLAMEPDARHEALKILLDIEIRAKQTFDPLHLQTVAILNAKARVLLHLAQYDAAESTNSDALARIKQWKIADDYPIYVEAKRRHAVFLKDISRRRS